MIKTMASSSLLAPHCPEDPLLFLYKETSCMMKFKVFLMPSIDSLFKEEKVLVICFGS